MATQKIFLHKKNYLTFKLRNNSNNNNKRDRRKSIGYSICNAQCYKIRFEQNAHVFHRKREERNNQMVQKKSIGKEYCGILFFFLFLE